MPRLWIKNPTASFDGHEAATLQGGVVVENGWIVETLAGGETPSQDVHEIHDASGCVLLPGLINTHHHCYQTLTRACHDALDKPLFAWLQALYPVWANLSGEMVAAATELAACELLASGCTTLVDHHYVFSEALEDAIDRQVEVMQGLGMRAVLTRGSMSLSIKDGGLPPDSVVQTEQQILDDSLRLIKTHHDAATGAMVQIALAPCSPFSVTAQLMRDTARLAEEHGVLLHTHLAETRDETAYCLDQVGQRPADYMESLGWLTERSWFAHGIYFNKAEIERLGQARCGIAHCPTSNMTLASGICRVADLEQAGVHVGLGVDGSASNDSSNMMQEVRQSLLIQRLGMAIAPAPAEDSPRLVSHLDALRWGTAGGATLLHRPELGRLQVGAAADLALFKLDDLRFSGSEDPLAALVLCGAHRADAVMVNGHWRVLEGRLRGVDEADLTRRHASLARQLREAI
jgi:8-oxoguanine deaminase